MKGKCILIEPCSMYFPTLTGEECLLHFGRNTKFDFEKVNIRRIRLSRKNITIFIKPLEFNRLYKVVSDNE